MNKKQETILVVGASGFIGYPVCKALVSAGFDVRALDPFIRNDLPKQIEVYQGATTDLHLVTRALTNCCRVIFLGGNSAPGAVIPTITNEIERELLPVIQFAESAANAGCKQFIFASSGGTVYGYSTEKLISENHYCSPISTYGASKLAIESYLKVLSRSSNMKTLSLRLSNPYGPGQVVKRNQGFIAAAMSAAFKQHPLSIWGDGSAIRDYLFIDDVADAFAASCQIESLTDTINIGSGIGFSLLDICKAIEKITKKNIDIKFEPARKVDIPSNVIDIQSANKKLNWSPSITLEKGLLRTSNWWNLEEK